MKAKEILFFSLAVILVFSILSCNRQEEVPKEEMPFDESVIIVSDNLTVDDTGIGLTQDYTLPADYKCSGAKFFLKECKIMPDGGASLSIINYARESIDKFWFVMQFEDGTERFHNFTQRMEGNGATTKFDIDLFGLYSKYGPFKKIEFDPQLNKDGQDVICRNLRVVFEPEVSCR